jgi:hypothetical protein
MPINRASQKAKSDHVFGQRRRPAKMFRAGLYAGVSTNDQQILVMQSQAMLARLDDYASSLRVLPDAVSFG